MFEKQQSAEEIYLSNRGKNLIQRGIHDFEGWLERIFTRGAPQLSKHYDWKMFRNATMFTRAMQMFKLTPSPDDGTPRDARLLESPPTTKHGLEIRDKVNCIGFVPELYLKDNKHPIPV